MKAYSAIMTLHAVYLAFACYLLATDHLKVSIEPIPACLTTIEDGAAMPGKLAAAEGR